MTDLNYTLVNYIDDLIDLNAKYIQPLVSLGVDGEETITAFGAQVLTGVTEEYLEVFDEFMVTEQFTEAVMLEIGDMLAYLTLSIVAYTWSGDMDLLGYSKDAAYQLMSEVIEEFINEAEDDEELVIDPIHVAMKLAGNTKRFFRGDHNLQYQFMVISWLELIEVFELDIQKVAKANMDKLKARIANKGTFKGRGNR